VVLPVPGSPSSKTRGLRESAIEDVIQPFDTGGGFSLINSLDVDKNALS
jgi:hypothetical protein